MPRLTLYLIKKKTFDYFCDSVILLPYVDDMSSENFQRWEYPISRKGAKCKLTPYLCILS